jgi:hypothetical protein
MNNSNNAAQEHQIAAATENDVTDTDGPGSTASETQASLGFARQFDGAGREIFPVHALPPILRDYATEVCEVRGVPIGLVAPSILVAVSASLGGGIEMDTWEGKKTHGNLYWLGIAASGAGKGTACDETFAPSISAENSIVAEWRRNTLPQVRAAESMIKEQIKKLKSQATKGQMDWSEAFTEIAALEAQLDDASRLKIEPRLVCEDVTREKLGDILAAQPREALASVSSEARGILDVLTRMKGEDIYAKAWSGESYRNDRRSTKTIRLTRPCLSVCWMIQTDAWEKLLENESFANSGMLPRFLVSAPDTPVSPLPAETRRFEPGVRDAYRDLIIALLKNYRHREGAIGIVSTDSAVLARFRAYENQIRALRSPGGLMQDIQSYAARWSQNAFRIALVLHAATHGTSAHDRPLAIETADSALAIMDWFRSEQVRLLKDHITKADQERANRLEEAIRRYGANTATIRDLTTRNGFKEPEIVALTERLPERFRIKESRAARGSKGGRPSRSVELVLSFTKPVPFPDLIAGIAGSGGAAA